VTSTGDGSLGGSPRFSARSWGADGWSVVELAGELDLASVARAEADLTRAEREGAGLVLDLRALEFIDSTGLRLVVRAAGRLHERGGRLVVARGPRAVHRVFELAGLDGRLEMTDDPRAFLATDPDSRAPTLSR
jgi:anti-sigma B factor antagonist